MSPCIAVFCTTSPSKTLSQVSKTRETFFKVVPSASRTVPLPGVVCRRGFGIYPERFCGKSPSFLTRQSSAADQNAGVVGTSEESRLVDQMLSQIGDSDRGSDLSAEIRDDVDDMVRKLEELGGKEPLDDPRLWGDYDVSYVSAGKSENSNPAGGRFRGKLGKMLFRTTDVEQNLVAPDIVVNKVGFKLFGFIPGCVSLLGKVSPEPEDQKLWVRARFQPPSLSLLGLPALNIGPTSSVLLATPYLDDKVRLGRGSRGSLFIFTRLEREQAPLPAPATTSALEMKKVAFMLLPAVVAIFTAVRTLTRALPPKLVPMVWISVALVVGAFGLILRNGGIVDEDASDPPEAATTS